MTKRKFAAIATAFAAATMTAGPAQAMDGPAFNIRFYSDASQTTAVGFARARCTPDPVATLQWGVSSQYQEVIYIGECIDGVLYYY